MPFTANGDTIVGDHRPVMPEVAGRDRPRMASCPHAMREIRELRRAAGLKQREFAALLSVPLETLRTWDSGRRAVPLVVLQRARAALVHHHRQRKWLPLDELAPDAPHTRGVSTSDRCRRQSRGVSVGIATANAVARLVATRPRTGRPANRTLRLGQHCRVTRDLST